MKLIAWYGSWQQLNKVFEWCSENAFLKYDYAFFKEKWLKTYFRLVDIWPKEIGEVDVKLTWHGSLGSLIDIFILLGDYRLIRERKIRRWVSDRFIYVGKTDAVAINHNSLKVIWTRIKEKSKDADKGVTLEERNSLVQLLESFKPIRNI